MSEKLTRTQIKNLERLGGVNPADASFTRRQFATQVGGFAAVAGAAVGTGLLVRDQWGMEGVKPPPPVKLKDYSVALHPSKPSMVVVRSTPLTRLTTRARTRRCTPGRTRRSRWSAPRCRRWGREGGTPLHHQGGRRRHQAERRLRQDPDLGATTSPDTVSAVVKLCFAAGARKVIVADNPINNPESCFFKTKVGDAALRAGAELMMPQDSYFEQLYVGGETITPPGGCSTGRSARRRRSSGSPRSRTTTSARRRSR